MLVAVSVPVAMSAVHAVAATDINAWKEYKDDKMPLWDAAYEGCAPAVAAFLTGNHGAPRFEPNDPSQVRASSRQFRKSRIFGTN